MSEYRLSAMEPEKIDELRFGAFKTNLLEDKMAYYKEASAYFQDRHVRALIRADLPLTTAQLEADPRVRALVEALEGCEAAITRGWAFYPDKVKGYTLDALENARAALAQLKEPKP